MLSNLSTKIWSRIFILYFFSFFRWVLSKKSLVFLETKIQDGDLMKEESLFLWKTHFFPLRVELGFSLEEIFKILLHFGVPSFRLVLISMIFVRVGVLPSLSIFGWDKFS